jgi:hypothetical protein
MLKTTAIQLLGGTPKEAAAAMGYKSAHAIYLWPDVLPQSVSDKVNGALLRINGQTFDQRIQPIAGGATHQQGG